MKLILTLTTLLFLCHTQMQAQLSFGVKTGFVKAWEKYGDIGLPDDAKIHINGIQISGIADLSLSNLLSLRFEPGIVQRGAACYPGWISPTIDTRFRFNYVEAPIMLTVRNTFLNSRFGLSGKIGYGVSHIVSAKRESFFTDGNGETELEKVDLKNSGWLQRWDHGLYAGGGISYQIGSNRLIAEVTHYHGLVDVDRNNTTKNRSMEYSISYLYTLASERH